MRYIRFDKSTSKWNKYQRGHMLYFYATLKAIAITTLKFNQLGYYYDPADIAQLCLATVPEDCDSNPSWIFLDFCIFASWISWKIFHNPARPW